AREPGPTAVLVGVRAVRARIGHLLLGLLCPPAVARIDARPDGRGDRAGHAARRGHRGGSHAVRRPDASTPPRRAPAARGRRQPYRCDLAAHPDRIRYRGGRARRDRGCDRVAHWLQHAWAAGRARRAGAARAPRGGGRLVPERALRRRHGGRRAAARGRRSFHGRRAADAGRGHRVRERRAARVVCARGLQIGHHHGKDTPMNVALDEALERLRGAGGEIAGGGMPNHGPMAAEALVALGRGDVATRWAERYRTGLATMPAPSSAITIESWHEALGAPSRFGDWAAFLRAEVARASWRTVLASWIGALVPAMNSAGTHGLIRTAHALRALEDAETPLRIEELAVALAFWASYHRAVPTPAPRARQRGLPAPLRPG